MRCVCVCVCVCGCGEVCAFCELKRRPRGKPSHKFHLKRGGDVELKYVMVPQIGGSFRTLTNTYSRNQGPIYNQRGLWNIDPRLFNLTLICLKAYCLRELRFSVSP